MGSMRPRSTPLGRLAASGGALLGALGLLVACGGDGNGSGDATGASVPAATVIPTVPNVGHLPDPIDATRAPIMVQAPVNSDGSPAALIGEAVDGNRVLMIGDSILASTSSRYGGQMCATVVPLGWKVQVEAEPSRFIDFGNFVLDRVLPDDVTAENDWDAAVVFLGSNYGSDPVVYEAELREILDRLAPRPTLLFTVTQYRQNYAEVNEVVRRLDAEYDNVTLVDWEIASQTPGVLSGDRLHPSDAGRQLIADLVAAALGPARGEGECLKSQFRNDSNVNGDPDEVLGRPGSGNSSGGSRGPTSTVPRGTVPRTTTPPPVTTAPPPATTAPPITSPPDPPPVATSPAPTTTQPAGGDTGDLDPGDATDAGG